MSKRVIRGGDFLNEYVEIDSPRMLFCEAVEVYCGALADYWRWFGRDPIHIWGHERSYDEQSMEKEASLKRPKKVEERIEAAGISVQHVRQFVHGF